LYLRRRQFVVAVDNKLAIFEQICRRCGGDALIARGYAYLDGGQTSRFDSSSIRHNHLLAYAYNDGKRAQKVFSYCEPSNFIQKKGKCVRE
jgi:hypothetical protein